MLNSVDLIGRLTADPELRYTPSGVATTTFTLAVDRDFKNKEGEREADFIRIVVWRQLAELCANYLKKGSQASVKGRIQTGSYTNSDGKKVYTSDVVAENVYFLSPAGEKANDKSNVDPFANESKTADINDEDLPF